MTEPANQKHEPLGIYYQNVRGLRTKSKDIYLAATACNHNIIVLTETWLNPSHFSEEFLPSKYLVYRCDRSSANSRYSRGGGVLTAVSTSHQSTAIPLQRDDVEHLAVKISLDDTVILIYCLYIPPHSSSDIFNAHIDAISDLSNQRFDLVFVIGDFNLPSIRWVENPEDTDLIPFDLSSGIDKFVCDSLHGEGLHQLNPFMNRSGNILDLVFANDTESIHVERASHPLLTVDEFHAPLDIFVSRVQFSNDLEQNTAPVLNYRRCDFTGFGSFIASFDYEQLFAPVDMENAADIFQCILNQALEKFVPTFVPSSSDSPPWYDRELRHLKNLKNKSHRTYINARTDSALYEAYTSDIMSSINTTPRKFWDFVNRKRKTSGYPSIMSYNGSESSSCPVILDYFASYFEANYITDADSNYDLDILLASNADDTVITISREEIWMGLQSLKTSTCGMHPVILKNCAASFVEPLFHLFACSLTTGLFPQQWKLSCVTAIHKSGPRTEVSNYRGIAILPTIAKFFESLIQRKLYERVHTRISPHQHGFMSARSCTTNTVDFSSYIIRSLDAGAQVDALFTDMTKAFDRVSHTRLIRKLANIGLGASTLRWIWSYLRNRRQRVRIGNNLSRLIHVPSGVPQGSHIGPLLFVIFINDIADSIDNTIRYLLYADDFKIFCKMRDARCATQVAQQLCKPALEISSIGAARTGLI